MTCRIPAEWEFHACCWMAWAVGAEWNDWAKQVKDELAAVVRAIARFEPVKLLTAPDQVVEARARFSGCNVEIVEGPIDDIWMRDIAPTFAVHSGEIVAIDFNFNSWGNTRDRPARPGDRLAGTGSAIFRAPRVSTSFVAEGGAFITDGEGTLITTESCLLNKNRNPFDPQWIRKQKIEQAFEQFGARKVIWLKGDASEPITSGHIDGYALFTAPGVLLVETIEDDEREPSCRRDDDIALLKNSLDATGRSLKVESVRPPRKGYLKCHGRNSAPCYLNVYVANGAVIGASFGDPGRDQAAKDALTRAFPGRNIEMLRIDHITSGGGGVRCLTQPMATGEKRNEC